MEIIRTRFKKDIVAEVAFPSRRGKRGDRVAILCIGMPTMPGKTSVIEFLARKGFVVVSPRYRGSWESGGEFLRQSPEKDIRDVIGELGKPLIDLWTGARHKIYPKEVIIFASSFGGAAGLLLSSDRRVKKVIALSPVVDWSAFKKKDLVDTYYGMVRRAFGEGYRMKKSAWSKLASGKFYNPMMHIDKIEGEKVLIFQAQDDKTVPFRPVESFAKQTSCKLVLRKQGGHFGLSELQKASSWNRIKPFLKA